LANLAYINISAGIQTAWQNAAGAEEGNSFYRSTTKLK
jgi:hypothetical protein